MKDNKKEFILYKCVQCEDLYVFERGKARDICPHCHKRGTLRMIDKGTMKDLVEKYKDLCEEFGGIYYIDRAIEEKPPLGLKPRRIHDEERVNELANAIHRYVNNVKEIPIEWIEEYNELIEKYFTYRE